MWAVLTALSGGALHPLAIAQDTDPDPRDATAVSAEQVEVQVETERAASPASAPAIPPTAPCMGTVSGGGSGTAFGISIGKTVLDKGCEERETARLLYEMGWHFPARQVLCRTKAVSRTIGYAACMGVP